MAPLTRYLLGLLLLAFVVFAAAQETTEQAATEQAAVTDAPAPATDAAPAATDAAPAATDATAVAVPGSTSAANGQEFSTVGLCEVCIYVLENKMQRQPFVCRGLKDPSYQQICVQVMESLMWWISNEVYWVNYGCQMNNNGAVQWVRPCPAHAVCSWLQHLYLRKPYCAADPNYPKPA